MSTDSSQLPDNPRSLSDRSTPLPAVPFQFDFSRPPRKRPSPADPYTDPLIAITHQEPSTTMPNSSQSPDPKLDAAPSSVKHGTLSGGMAKVRAFNVSRIDKRLQALEPVLEKVDEAFSSLVGVPQIDKANAAYTLYCMRADIMARAQAFIEGNLQAPSGFPSAAPLPSPGRFSVPAVHGTSSSMGSNKDHALPQRPSSLPSKGNAASNNNNNKKSVSYKDALINSPSAASSDSAKPRAKPANAMNKPNSKDERLFVRLSENSPLRHADMGPIASRIRSKIPQAAEAIQTIHRTSTGIAIVPFPGKSTVLEAVASQIAATCGAINAEKADPWIKFLLPRVPYRVQRLDENMSRTTLETVHIEELSAEVERAFGARPTQVAWSQHSEPDPNTRGVLVSFRAADLKGPVPATVHILAAKISVKARRQPLRVTQCTRCWDFHRSELCTKIPRCVICSSTSHSGNEHNPAIHTIAPCHAQAGNCKCPPRCANCHGPHPASFLQCPARPVANFRAGFVSKPSGEQIKKIRIAGDRLRKLEAAELCPVFGKNPQESQSPSSSPPQPTSTPQAAHIKSQN
jgi:hypothetical protein